MGVMGSSAFAAAAGAASWTAAECGLHRFAMREMRGRGMASVEHLRHHAGVTYFSPMTKKLALAAATTAIAYPATALLAGRRWATAFSAGLIGTYFAYEVTHRRLHTHPPRNSGFWARGPHPRGASAPRRPIRPAGAPRTAPHKESGRRAFANVAPEP